MNYFLDFRSDDLLQILSSSKFFELTIDDKNDLCRAVREKGISPNVFIINYDNKFQTGDTMSVCLLSIYLKSISPENIVILAPKKDSICILGDYMNDWFDVCGVLNPPSVKDLRQLLTFCLGRNNYDMHLFQTRNKQVLHITELQTLLHHGCNNLNGLDLGLSQFKKVSHMFKNMMRQKKYSTYCT
ncbi:hypothetical protein [Francisella salina]|uniref:Uncharacterized protein n=1 Tax=Francisella salina TaxID=573569 RepID=A0ABM5MC62_FRAST|nr:hypothetical protein [Francisella salina]AEI36819.1 hypothetical protein F7308_1895 [Francisella salina]